MRNSSDPLVRSMLAFVLLLAIGCHTTRSHDILCPAQRMVGTPPCSAVVVGAHVVLTAKHCLDFPDSEGLASLTLNGTLDDYTGSCTASPNDDLALCAFEKEFPKENVVRLAPAQTGAKRGSRVVYAGHGCTWGLTCNDHITWEDSVNFGRAKVHSEPSADTRTFEIKTLLFFGGNRLCPGDSGGPLCSPDSGELLGIAYEACLCGKKRKARFTAITIDSVRTWMCGWQKDHPSRTIEGLHCDEV